MKTRTNNCLIIIAATLLFAGVWAEARSRNMDYDLIMRTKQARLERFEADEQEAIKAAGQFYLEALVKLQAPDKAADLQRAAAAAQARFDNYQRLPDNTAPSRHAEITKAKQLLRQQIAQAKQNRLRRTTGMLDAHIKQLTALHGHLNKNNPDDPRLAEIMQEIDDSRRTHAQLVKQMPDEQQ